jgi:hypothetical protein
MFFFEKKNQKTFACAAADSPAAYAIDESFLLLFFKKEDLPCLFCSRPKIEAKIFSA